MGLRRLGRLLTARRSTGRPLDETSTFGDAMDLEIHAIFDDDDIKLTA
jgi:hypothetical protein